MRQDPGSDALAAATGQSGLLARMRIDADLCLYDATRLISRRKSVFATGIDRIDLTAALEAREIFGARLKLLAKAGGTMAVLSPQETNALLDGLAARWQASRPAQAACPSLSWLPLRGLAGGAGANLPSPMSSSPARTSKICAEEALAWMTRLARRAGAFSQSRQAETLSNAARDGARMAFVTVSHTGIAQDARMMRQHLDPLEVRHHTYVHDVIPIRHPEFQRPGSGRRLARFLKNLAERDTRFFANSRQTAVEFADWSETGTSFGRLTAEVLYPHLPHIAALGATGTVATPETGSNRPFFLHVGSIEPRKNLLMLLHVWSRLAERLGADTPKLVLVGGNGWMNGETLSFLERSKVLKGHVTHHRQLDDTALAALIAQAEALVFPSLCEGLGLPLLEALAQGKNCVVSDIPVFREIAGDAATFVDPLDGPGWEKAIDAISAAKPEKRSDPDAVA